MKLSFQGESHPHVSSTDEIIASRDWEFNYDPSKSNMKLKDKLLGFIEKKFGRRLFEYRNYILAKK